MTRVAAWGALVFSLSWASPTWATEPTVPLTLSVVEASHQGNQVDPSLLVMKEKFTQSGFSYQSYHRLSSVTVNLEKGKASELKLPNGRQASVKLEEVKSSGPLVRILLPPLDTLYCLGREGSVFVRAGRYHDGVLILVLSPVAAH